jgi:hypothetical protein
MLQKIELCFNMGDPDREVRKSLFGDLDGKPTAQTHPEGGVQDTVRAIPVVEAQIVTNKRALESEMHSMRMKDLKKLIDSLETDRWMYDNDKRRLY